MDRVVIYPTSLIKGQSEKVQNYEVTEKECVDRDIIHFIARIPTLGVIYLFIDDVVIS